MDAVSVGWPLAALLCLLTAVAAAVAGSTGLAEWRAPVVAAARACAQLLAVSLVIGFVLRSMALVAGFIGVMLLVATATAARRITGKFDPSDWWLLLPMLGGVVPTVTLTLMSTAVPARPVAVLPVCGILVGGAMSATALAGRRTVDELIARAGEYEAGLALGLTRRQSVIVVGRPAAALALVPGLDQTRTVGLVTLPGAFVGVLLAGAAPIQAGAAQVLVLVALLASQAVSAALTVELVAVGRVPVLGASLKV